MMGATKNLKGQSVFRNGEPGQAKYGPLHRLLFVYPNLSGRSHRFHNRWRASWSDTASVSAATFAVWHARK